MDTPIDQELGRLEEVLAAAHDGVLGRHSVSRSRLLDHIADGDRVVTRRHPLKLRYALGGVGAGSATIAALLVVLFAPSTVANAVERVAQALQQVTSYSYRMEEAYVSTVEGRRVDTVIEGCWRRDPFGMRATTRIWASPSSNASPQHDQRELTCDIFEVHQTGETGILVDQLRRHYWRCEPVDASDLGGGSPAAVIYKICERRGKAVRDLGEKNIAGRAARGVELLLDDSPPETDLGPAAPETREGQARGWDWRDVTVELWYDAETDLPIEFQAVRRGEGFSTTIRYSQLQWNAAFPAATFDPIAPSGYDELARSPWEQDDD